MISKLCLTVLLGTSKSSNNIEVSSTKIDLIASSTSAYLKVGNVYDVTGGVSQFTVIDTGETFYQIKLGNNAIALGDFEKINTIGEN